MCLDLVAVTGRDRVPDKEMERWTVANQWDLMKR